MSLATPQELIEQAQSGAKLSAKERRLALAYLMASNPEFSNIELGKIFQVTEGQIRQDKKNIKKERVRLLKEDDVALVIADIALDFDRQLRDLEASKKKAKPGTSNYLKHCTELFRLRATMVELLQNLGYYPKNLGNMTVEKYSFQAIVSKDQRVSIRPADVEFSDTPPAIEGEFTDVPLRPEPALLPPPSMDTTTDVIEERTVPPSREDLDGPAA